MGELGSFGKILIFFGIVMIVVGGFFLIGNKIPFLGKLPGDIAVQKKNFGFYFPITTCIVISIIISLIMWLFGKR
jgi:formate hydrogenlyase subunit 3/multisubunit Na+/H+ antiporter MnhD subunit